MTGFANFEPSMGGKWLQTLKEIATENNSTTVFPMPIDLFEPFRAFAKLTGAGDDKSDDKPKT